MAKSSLISALAELEATPRNTSTGFPCKIKVIKASLEPADAEAIERVVCNKAVTINSIVKLLAAHGLTVGYSSVNNHRRRLEGVGCKCPVES